MSDMSDNTADVRGYYAQEYLALKDALQEWRYTLYCKGKFRLDQHLPIRHLLVLSDYRDNLNKHGSCQ